MNKTSIFLLPLLITSINVEANEATNLKKTQDMSDPLAVYTQFGMGATNKGLNVKVGKSYDPGEENEMAMNILEIKGFLGEALGWTGSNDRNNSIDSARLRNFKVNTQDGQGHQIDLDYTVKTESLMASYSIIQALPKFGPVQLYPLAGLGLTIQNGDFTGPEGEFNKKISGYTIPGIYGVVGGYIKIAINKKIWLNYNPMWLTTISGSDAYTEYAFEGHSSVYTNELALSYQFTPTFNVRYFANWTQYEDFTENQRVEFNYQF